MYPSELFVRKVTPGSPAEKGGLQPGDRVLFSSYAGEVFRVGDDELLLMREEDILAVIE